MIGWMKELSYMQAAQNAHRKNHSEISQELAPPIPLPSLSPHTHTHTHTNTQIRTCIPRWEEIEESFVVTIMDILPTKKNMFYKKTCSYLCRTWPVIHHVCKWCEYMHALYPLFTLQIMHIWPKFWEPRLRRACWKNVELGQHHCLQQEAANDIAVSTHQY